VARMKAVMKSVSTEIFENIIDRKCSVLNSKTTPNCETPFKVYVYCNKAKNQWRFSDYEGSYKNSAGEFVCAQQRVAAEFVCDSTANGWHISDLKIYDTPKKLSEFRRPLDRVWGSYCNDYCDPGCVSFGSTDYSCNDYWNWEKGLTRPPLSWQYVEDLGEAK